MNGKTILIPCGLLAAALLLGSGFDASTAKAGDLKGVQVAQSRTNSPGSMGGSTGTYGGSSGTYGGSSGDTGTYGGTGAYGGSSDSKSGTSRPREKSGSEVRGDTDSSKNPNVNPYVKDPEPLYGSGGAPIGGGTGQ